MRYQLPLARSLLHGKEALSLHASLVIGHSSERVLGILPDEITTKGLRIPILESVIVDHRVQGVAHCTSSR